jgi:hypothetical protein
MNINYIAGAAAVLVVLIYVIVGLGIKAIIKAVNSHRSKPDKQQAHPED